MPRLRRTHAHHRNLPARPETNDPCATPGTGRMTKRPSLSPRPNPFAPANRIAPALPGDRLKLLRRCQLGQPHPEIMITVDWVGTQGTRGLQGRCSIPIAAKHAGTLSP